jgi:hypothetical protein
LVDIGVCQIAIKRPSTILLKIFEECTIAALAVDPPSGNFKVFEDILCYRLPTQGIKVETLVGVRARSAAKNPFAKKRASRAFIIQLNSGNWRSNSFTILPFYFEFLLRVINRSIALLARRGWARFNGSVKECS